MELERLSYYDMFAVTKAGLLSGDDVNDLRAATGSSVADVRALLTNWADSHSEDDVKAAATSCLQKLESF